MESVREQSLNRRSVKFWAIALTVASAIVLGVTQPTEAQQRPTPASSARKPNILLIMADDIGWFNVSAYNLGVMGYRTPNIDRIAREGALFTDWYAEQSCTAGRAAFVTGQSPIRTGLTKVGLPGADIGLRAEDPSVAEILKPLGYATGQFGKNHLGDKDEFLPTAHGFDEFFGNLYHLNAEEEPENPDYPKNPQFRQRFGPRGVIKSSADGKIENTGPLTTKRMETVDEEFLGAALDFIDRQQRANKPWFLYFNPTRMHVWTHLKPASQGKTGLGIYPDGMAELDGYVGQLLKKLDDLGVADNTIVVFTTDNGAEVMSWPDGGTTPFRGEKATNWEGGFRAPTVMRWSGTIKPGTVYNEMFSHYDFIPTFAAAGGDPDIVAKLLRGTQIGNKTFKVHLDGYNLMPFFKGDVKESPRKEFVYWNDDGQLVAIRYNDWKAIFLEQDHKGIGVWQGQFNDLRLPKLFNLRSDPFERGDESILYNKWLADRAFVQVPLQALAAGWLESFKEFPPRQKPASFNLDDVMRKIEAAGASAN
ncbi:arylsulfatase [Bradyrhizobium sp.]|uniref:arylsulfatase n=1 Tax=Bradyrhizobium sp. TaxID=376 RepID=UPI003BAF8327